MSNDTYTPIDPRGDLTLVVGEETKAHLLVCSRAMARASPAFSAMLNGQSREAKLWSNPYSSWTVTLPDDDPMAFKIILRIIHSQLHLVTSKLSRKLFFKLYVLADKYLMKDLILPFATLWYTDDPYYDLEWYGSSFRPQPDELREHMTIAHFMGNSKAFWNGLGYCALSCQPGEVQDGELVINEDGESTLLVMEGIPGNCLGK